MNKTALAVCGLALSVAGLAAVIYYRTGDHPHGTAPDLAAAGTHREGGQPRPQLPDLPPDPFPALVKLTGAQAAEVDQAIRGVSAYPRRTRLAILDLAQATRKYPSLLDDLARLRTGSTAEVDEYLTSHDYSHELQRAAALVLVEAPDTIDRMKERPELVRVVGEAWSAPPGRLLITSLLDAAAAGQEKTRDAAADRWAARLKADPRLAEQFVTLLRDYTHRAHADDPEPDDSLKAYHYGTHLSKDGFVVDDVPSPEVINYALAVGPKYQAVAAALIQQFLDGANQDDYNSAVGGWYAANGSSIPQSARQDNSDYYELLQELAQLASAAAANAGGSSTGDSGTGTGSGNDSGTGSGSGNGSGNSVNSYGDSYNVNGNASGNTASRLLAANAGRYPKLSDWAARNPLPKEFRPPDFTRLKPPPEPKDRPPFPVGKLPFEPPSGGPRAPFADHLKAIGPAERGRPMPAGAKNPFHLASMPPKAMPKAPMVPQQVFRGAPSMGQQLSRAPGRMGAAWAHPRGGAPRIPKK